MHIFTSAVTGVAIWQRPASCTAVTRSRRTEVFDTFRVLKRRGEYWASTCRNVPHLLHVHLQGEQAVVHDEDASHEQWRSAANNAVTDLMRYIRRPRGHPFDSLTFLDYFEQFTVQPKQRRKRVNRNQQRGESDGDNSDGFDSDDPDPAASDHQDGYQNFVYRRQSPCVCRMNFLKPDCGDLCCLRLLLYHIPASSWEDIRTVDNVLHPTHEAAAQARGLVADLQEFDLTLREAKTFALHTNFVFCSSPLLSPGALPKTFGIYTSTISCPIIFVKCRNPVL